MTADPRPLLAVRDLVKHFPMGSICFRCQK